MQRQRKMRSLNMSYARQQTIYRTCRNYAVQNDAVKTKIRRTARTVCRADEQKYQALMAILVTDMPIRRIALEHYYDESVLYRLRKAFYEEY